MASLFNNRTTTIKTTRPLYTQENEFNRQQNISLVTLLVICAVFALIFCVAVFVFVVWFRRRKLRMASDQLYLQQRGLCSTIGSAGCLASSTRSFDSRQMDIAAKEDLPPPYPVQPISPPSYEVACGYGQGMHI